MPMKAGIHPEYHVSKVTCTCGAEYEVGSTRQGLKIDVCARCHPFFTGQQKFVDAGGRVDRFLKKYGKTKIGR